MSRSGVMSDRAMVVLASATAAGGWLALEVSPLIGFAVVGVALHARRSALLWVGAFLLASSLGARAWDGLDDAPIGPLEGVATIVTDPEPIDRGIRVDVRLGSHRYEARAFGAAAGSLRERAAGERVELRGSARRAPQASAGFLAPRHVGAELDVEAVGAWSPGDPAARLGNIVRRTFLRGASVLAPDQRALFAGFVLGDDRQQSAVVADDFRAAGLTHLLAVSGQNVAFVLVVAGPLLRRLEFRGRFVATVTLIGFFALVTRFEPSVLRAAAMASLASLATVLGREASGLRLLALAVSGLVLVDPLLVRSIGFGLSVAASAGILLLARPLARAIPGPRSIADASAVTVAAQLGVAPLLVPTFGGLPVVALPANLLAVPVAGPLMAWGMTGGLAAGVIAPLAGDGVARVLHLPTNVLIGWIATVARVASRLALGELRTLHLLVATAAGAMVLGPRLVVGAGGRPAVGARVAAFARRRVPTLVAGIGLVTAVVWPVATIRAQPPTHVRPSAGAELWTSAGGVGVLAIDGRARASPLLEGLRRAGVRAVGLVVVRSGGGSRRVLEAVAAIAARYRSPPIVAAEGADIPGARPARSGAVILVGGVAVLIEVHPDGRLSIRIRAPPNVLRQATFAAFTPARNPARGVLLERGPSLPSSSSLRATPLARREHHQGRLTEH